MRLLQHKGYYGSVDVNIEDNCLYGKIEFIKALVNYEANSISGIKNEFNAAVDDYLETCKELGYEPELSCKGSFNIRVGSDLHKEALIAAKKQGVNLNEFVKESIRKAVA